MAKRMLDGNKHAHKSTERSVVRRLVLYSSLAFLIICAIAIAWLDPFAELRPSKGHVPIYDPSSTGSAIMGPTGGDGGGGEDLEGDGEEGGMLYPEATDPPKSHTHSYTYKTETVEPTCSEQGFVAHFCECGEFEKTDILDALGHNYSGTTTAPTCTEQGYTTFICSRCQHMYKGDFRDALGHAFGEWTEIEAPTCTTDGESSRKCSRCERSETQALVARHTYTDTVTPPTCQSPGYTTHECICGKTYVDSRVGAIGHRYDGDNDPSCSLCGHIRELSSHNSAHASSGGCSSSISALPALLLAIAAILPFRKRKSK